MEKFLLTISGALFQKLFLRGRRGRGVFLEGGGATKKRLSGLEPSPLNEELYSIMDIVKTSNTESQMDREKFQLLKGSI